MIKLLNRVTTVKFTCIEPVIGLVFGILAGMILGAIFGKICQAMARPPAEDQTIMEQNTETHA